MRRYLPWILLAVSVALNAFFVGGHIYARRMAEVHGFHRPGGPPPVEQLGLTSEQKEMIGKMRASMRERVRVGRPIDRELGLALFDELLKPTHDGASLDAMARQLSERRAAYVRPGLDDLSAFLRSLSPEQRTRVREVVEHRGPTFLIAPWGGGERSERRPPPGAPPKG